MLGIGRLGGNIAGDLAFNGHSVRVWDADKNALDKLHERSNDDKKTRHFRDSSDPVGFVHIPR